MTITSIPWLFGDQPGLRPAFLGMPLSITGGMQFTWHLSIINAGDLESAEFAGEEAEQELMKQPSTKTVADQPNTLPNKIRLVTTSHPVKLDRQKRPFSFSSITEPNGATLR